MYFDFRPNVRDLNGTTTLKTQFEAKDETAAQKVVDKFELVALATGIHMTSYCLDPVKPE